MMYSGRMRFLIVLLLLSALHRADAEEDPGPAPMAGPFQDLQQFCQQPQYEDNRRGGLPAGAEPIRPAWTPPPAAPNAKEPSTPQRHVEGLTYLKTTALPAPLPAGAGLHPRQRTPTSVPAFPGPAYQRWLVRASALRWRQRWLRGGRSLGERRSGRVPERSCAGAGAGRPRAAPWQQADCGALLLAGSGLQDDLWSAPGRFAAGRRADPGPSDGHFHRGDAPVRCRPVAATELPGVHHRR